MSASAAAYNERVARSAAAEVQGFWEEAVRQWFHTFARAASARLDGAPGIPKDTWRATASVRFTVGAKYTGPEQEILPSYAIPGAPEIDAALRKWSGGQIIFATWAVPYAARLQRGWSKQAPDGFLWQAVDVANSRSSSWRYRPDVKVSLA